MRFKRRVARPKRKTQWLLSANLACAQLLRAQGCETEVSDPNTFLMVFSPSGDAILGSAGETNDVTVVRMVGDWHLGCTMRVPVGSGSPQIFTANIIFVEGMYIADMPVTSGTTILDPSDAGDMVSKDWMWMRSSVWTLGEVLPLTSTGTAVATPQTGTFDPHYDVRVKRKMRANEGIVYAVSVFIDASATVNPNQAAPAFALGDFSAYAYGSGRALVMMP